jgi:eukaryotic-like serine/threonine-protein kinase
MTSKINCWEYKKCHREPGGSMAKHLGVCPVPTSQEHDGVHGGKNAGRACWVVAGSMCSGQVQGSYVQKFDSCKVCDFYLLVMEEEKGSASGFAATPFGMMIYLRNKANHLAGKK